MSFYTNVIKTKKAIERTITSSNPTDWLKNERTVHKYYQDLLKRNKKEKSRLMTVKEVEGEWRLKIQCGKFSHPLYIDGDTTYELANFHSKEEALENFAEWVADFQKGVPGVVKAVEKGYNQWRESNSKNTINLTDYYRGEQS